jgi:hypothetical protein
MSSTWIHGLLRESDRKCVSWRAVRYVLKHLVDEGRVTTYAGEKSYDRLYLKAIPIAPAG